MIVMSKSRRLMRLVLRPVMLALGIAQLAVAVAPASERLEARELGSHVELDGTSIHYVHDDTACPACQAQNLIGRVAPPVRLVLTDVLDPQHAPTGVIAAPPALAHHSTAPRAPPVDRIG